MAKKKAKAETPKPDTEESEGTGGTRRFRVVDGKHHDRDRTYNKGELVESEEDLAAKFPGKFEEYQPSSVTGKFDAARRKVTERGVGPPKDRDDAPAVEPHLDQMDEVFDKGSTSKTRPDTEDQEEAEEEIEVGDTDEESEEDEDSNVEVEVEDEEEAEADEEESKPPARKTTKPKKGAKKKGK